MNGMGKMANKKNGTVTTRVVCTVCFLLFSFLWLYMFQADVLAVAQHTLSHGVTHYDRTIGAVLITVCLSLLQQGVYAVTRLSRRTHALTYLPSFLFLAFLSGFSAGSTSSAVAWSLLIPVVLALWGAGVWLARQLLPFEKDGKLPTGLFSRRVWLNLSQMAAMMLAVAALGNTNAVYHFKAHAETALARGDADEALRVGRRSLETDSRLTMLRAYALSRKGIMGERLFCYPVTGKGDDLLPASGRLMLLPADSIWKHLGGRPIYRLTARQYYQALEKDSLATAAVADYVLCGLLIDRDLDAFAETLPRYYDLSEQLPKHYREALTLYRHLRSTPYIIYEDPVMEEDWEDMQLLEKQYAKTRERQLNMLEHYGNSYWYYYYYR